MSANTLAKSPLRGLLTLLVAALAVNVTAGALHGGEPDAAALRAELPLAQSFWEAGCRAEANCGPAAVDLYYRAAVVAYACLATADDPYALGMYNAAIGRTLKAATRHGRIDPSSKLLINTPWGELKVPITHRCF